MNILKCSSCGEDHKSVDVKQSDENIEIDKIIYDEYFLCPNTNEKVYFINLNKINIQ
jgi:hypothetical protein